MTYPRHNRTMIAALMAAALASVVPVDAPSSPRAPKPATSPEELSARQRKRREKLARRAERARLSGIVKAEPDG